MTIKNGAQLFKALPLATFITTGASWFTGRYPIPQKQGTGS